ncbi:hypothetical protein D3C72_2076910 [compost metagenome]
MAATALLGATLVAAGSAGCTPVRPQPASSKPGISRAASARTVLLAMGNLSYETNSLNSLSGEILQR